MKLTSSISTAAVAALCWFLLDHFATELFLPKVPRTILRHATAVVVTVLAMILVVRSWAQFISWLPRPWFPRPFWRVFYWLKHRPRVSLLLAAPKMETQGAALTKCVIHLTIQRNLANLPLDAAIDFDRAQLLMSFRKDGHRREVVFRPVEAGGFLGLDVSAKSQDAIMIEFSAVRLPIAATEAPDFMGDYTLELCGVEVVVRSKRPLRGKLPVSTWYWSGAAAEQNLVNPYLLHGFDAIR